jgi:hypothetical protein
MKSFSVEPAELIRLAARTRDRQAELAGMPAGKYALNPRELDVPELAEPLDSVQAASSRALEVINADLLAFAERLSAAGNGYQEVDTTLARHITDVIARLS